MSTRKRGPIRDGTLHLVVRRTIEASPERLFRAWTEPDQLMKWWGPPPARCLQAEIDLRVGGKYRIANAFPDGTVIWIAGAFERISPFRELVYTWHLEGTEGAVERVTIRFEGSKNATEVIVLHERIGHAEGRDRHELGWNACLDGLVRYASTNS